MLLRAVSGAAELPFWSPFGLCNERIERSGAVRCLIVIQQSLSNCFGVPIEAGKKSRSLSTGRRPCQKTRMSQLVRRIAVPHSRSSTHQKYAETDILPSKADPFDRASGVQLRHNCPPTDSPPDQGVTSHPLLYLHSSPVSESSIDGYVGSHEGRKAFTVPSRKAKAQL